PSPLGRRHCVEAGAARSLQHVDIGQQSLQVTVEGIASRESFLVGGELLQHRLPQVRNPRQESAVGRAQTGYYRSALISMLREQVLDQFVIIPGRQTQGHPTKRI